MLRFALVYGSLSYLLAPLLGAGFVHLMQYAWPLFLVALPQLFNELPGTPSTPSQRAAGLGCFALHLATGTLAAKPLLVPWFLPRIGIALALWLAGYWLLRQWLRTALPETPANTV